MHEAQRDQIIQYVKEIKEKSKTYFLLIISRPLRFIMWPLEGYPNTIVNFWTTYPVVTFCFSELLLLIICLSYTNKNIYCMYKKEEIKIKTATIPCSNCIYIFMHHVEQFPSICSFFCFHNAAHTVCCLKMHYVTFTF